MITTQNILILLGGSSQKALKVLDSGNAILIDIASGIKKWESFLCPTDTFLPGMKMNSYMNLTSWKDINNPSSGSFMFKTEETEYVIINQEKSRYHWKSGSGSKLNFQQEPLSRSAYLLLTNSTERPQNTNLCKPNNTMIKKWCLKHRHNMASNSFIGSNYSRLLMNHTGYLQYYSWVEDDKQWRLDWHAPKDECSIYGVCGKFSICRLMSNKATCSCLLGFEDIGKQDTSAGCKRTNDVSFTDSDEFKNISMVEVENQLFSIAAANESECKKRCLQSSTCAAYSFTTAIKELLWAGRPEGTSKCWIWDSDLNNIRVNGKHNISYRISQGSINQAKALSRKNSSPFLTVTRLLIFVMTILVILLLGSVTYISYKRLVIHQGTSLVLQTHDHERRAIELLDLHHSEEDDTKGIGIPFFQLEGILAATENFSEANKLGRGGFGPVYKGKLPGGQEVAVKRLSSYSAQGLEEFRNEVMLIAKLQHRNLVRLLGYCVKGNDKILVYEYMPNKSLDTFIFDGETKISLDWAKRFEIIIGIARGLLYLHQDSRLRIIHRDLKTSNILLDGELNPKISDFGLAKIVQGREMEASTNRVVGTYGYMAPEYALDGLFSIKSDVFSFGVVVLEIISGKKNIGSAEARQNLSPLGYAWNLWKPNTRFKLLDRKLLESSNSMEVLKCIIVGLLCVQEDPGDRPTMTNVVLMLAGDITSLPNPKQPAFVERKTMASSSSSSYKLDLTEAGMTLPEGL